MRMFGRSIDGRLARLPHIGSLGLPGQQQRVCVRVLGVVDDPADEASEGDNEKRRVSIVPSEELGNGAVKLLDKARHGAQGGGRAEQSRGEDTRPAGSRS